MKHTAPKNTPAMALNSPYKPLNLSNRFAHAYLGAIAPAKEGLAKQLGIHKVTLWRYMSTDDMPAQVLLKMADILNMPIEDLCNPTKPIRTIQLALFPPGQQRIA